MEVLGGLVFLALIACTAIAYGKIRSARELQQSRDERRRQEVADNKRASQVRITEESRARRARQIRNWEDVELSDWEERGLSLIEEHKYDLYTERNRLTRQGPYGIVDDQAWIEEGIPYFSEAILMPSLTRFICNKYNTDDIDSINAYKDDEWINFQEEHSMDGQFPEWIRPEDFTYIPSTGLEQKLSVWCVEHINHALEKISLKEVGPQTSGEEFELICKELGTPEKRFASPLEPIRRLGGDGGSKSRL
jgi:hypothetical protein